MNSNFFLNSKREPRQDLILDILHELVILFNLFITGFHVIVFKDMFV